MTFEEKITTALVYDAIVRAGPIYLRDIHKLLQARSEKKKKEIYNSIRVLKYHELVKSIERGIYDIIEPEPEIPVPPPPIPIPPPPPPEIMFRHYVAGYVYMGVRPPKNAENVYALSFKTDRIDIEAELIDAILEEFEEDRGWNWGYSIDETREGMNESNTYPEIEVGQL